MSDSPALPQHVPLVVATRGGAVESVHYGSVAVADADGNLIGWAGDVRFPMFTRSTLKPFQALPFVSGGGPAAYGFSAAQVALLCASHSGEPRHVAAVADMLARAGCSEGDLRCGCHVPLWYAATGQDPPPGLLPSPLAHNCSGKHAGFLAWCRQHGAPLASYLAPDHPLQQAIRRQLAGLAGLSEAGLVRGIDGCGAPNYALPLAILAGLYARLAAAGRREGPDAPLAGLFSAMVGHPEMVAGEGRDDLLLMQAAPGDRVAKGGAEGVQALGCASRGVGIAIKLADGGRRGLREVVASVLERLGLPPSPGCGVPAGWRREEILNPSGTPTGELQAVFDLQPG